MGCCQTTNRLHVMIPVELSRCKHFGRTPKRKAKTGKMGKFEWMIWMFYFRQPFQDLGPCTVKTKRASAFGPA